MWHYSWERWVVYIIFNKPVKSKASFSAEIVKQGPCSYAEKANVVANEGKKNCESDVITGIGEEGKLLWGTWFFMSTIFPVYMHVVISYRLVLVL